MRRLGDVARDVQISFDAADPHQLARWWTERLGLTIHADSDQVEGLLSAGVISGEMVVRVLVVNRLTRS